MTPLTLVICGPCLTGKSTLARRLQTDLPNVAESIEGDDLHTAASIEKMRFGQPLDETDRVEWKARLCEKIQNRPLTGWQLITCSALKRAFRDDLRAAANDRIRFIFLVFSPSSAEKRARQRLRETWEALHQAPPQPPHYFQPAIYPQLIAGQFRDLEIPDSSETDCLVLNLDDSPQTDLGPQPDLDRMVSGIKNWLGT